MTHRCSVSAAVATVFSIGALAMAVQANASSRTANVFLSPTGSDANPCTKRAPCKSFARGYKVAKAGQVVELAGGRYTVLDRYRDELAPSKKASNADITFRPAAGTRVKISGRLIIKASHLVFRRLTFTGGSKGGWSTYPTARDVRFVKVKTYARFMIYSSSYITVRRGEVGNYEAGHWEGGYQSDGATPCTLGPPPKCRASGADPQVQQLKGEKVPHHLTFDGVYFHDVRNTKDIADHVECLQFAFGNYVTIRNSRFRHCGDDLKPYRTNNRAIQASANCDRETNAPYGFSHWRVENNFFDASPQYYTFELGVSDRTCSPNVDKPCTDFLIRNNSSLKPIGIRCTPGSPGIVVTGNIMNRIGETWVKGSWNRNFFESRYPVPPGSRNRFGNPRYVDRLHFNLHLRTSSPARGAGNTRSFPTRDIDGSRRPLGSRRPDAGADERF